MDRRLSGALAWGALLLIVGIPGFDMLNQRGSGDSGVEAGAANVVAGQTDAPAWKPGNANEPADAYGPLAPDQPLPTPSFAETDTDAGLPSIIDLASAPPPDPADTASVTPSLSIITLDDNVEPAAPAVVDDLDIDAVLSRVETDATMPDTTSDPVEASTPQTAEPPQVASSAEFAPAPSPEAAEIAERVRDALFASPDPVASADPPADIGLGDVPVPPEEIPVASIDGSVIADDLAAIATAPTGFSAAAPPPQSIPYPAPAIRRTATPVALRPALPPEPVPEVRPDNAIFFGDWTNTPPKTAATGPGR